MSKELDRLHLAYVHAVTKAIEGGAHIVSAQQAGISAICPMIEASEREAIIKIIVNGTFLHTTSPVAIWARDLVAAIHREREDKSR